MGKVSESSFDYICSNIYVLFCCEKWTIVSLSGERCEYKTPQTECRIKTSFVIMGVYLLPPRQRGAGQLSAQNKQLWLNSDGVT